MTTETTQAVGAPIERQVKPQLRLYVVRVMHEAYVLAADKAEAEDMHDEIERWEPRTVEVSSGSERLDGWEPAEHCLVYNATGDDITLAAARAGFPAA